MDRISLFTLTFVKLLSVILHNKNVYYYLYLINFTVNYSSFVHPESKNVTDGTIVTFTCGTSDHGKQVTWSIEPYVKKPTENRTTLQSGLQLATISFTATAQRNHTNVTCVISNDTTAVNVVALLLVQGTNVHICMNNNLYNY